MTWTTPPSLNTGDVLTDAGIDAITGDLQDLQDRVALLALNSAANLVAGDVCVPVYAGGDKWMQRTTAVGEPGPHYVALQAITNSATGYVTSVGYCLVNVVGTVGRGDHLQASATAGKAQAGEQNWFATALTAPVGGQVVAQLRGTPARVQAGRVYHSAAQAIGDSALTTLNFDSETGRFDPDTMHFTASAALTGTVAKTNGSATLTGTGTAFTTELSVGQVIDVPGGATERKVVIAIASDTSLTVHAAFANTASGQTATRTNQPLVARTAGIYAGFACVQFAANATGQRQAYLRVNETDLIDVQSYDAASTGVTIVSVTHVWELAQWDRVDVQVWQNSGGALNATTGAKYAPEFALVRVG